VVGVHADAEPHPQDPLLARRQRGQDPRRALAQIAEDGGIERLDCVLVLDEVAEMAVLLVADRRFQADRFLGDLQDLADLLQRHPELDRQFFRRRLAADLVQHLPRGADQLVDRLDHVDRNADRPRLVGDRPGNGLPDPPGGIGRELVAAAVLELVDRLHQADVALLDEVQELQAAVRVLLRDRDDEPEVGLDHLLLRLAGLALALLHRRDNGAEIAQRQAGFDADVADAAADRGDRLGLVADELLPLGLLADPLHPFRVDLVTLPLGNEHVALHPGLHREPQHATFQADDFLVHRIELRDEFLDPAVVEPDRLHLLQQFGPELVVSLELGRRDRGTGADRIRDDRFLERLHLLVDGGDRVELRDDLRQQRPLHGGQRDVRLLAVVTVRLGLAVLGLGFLGGFRRHGPVGTRLAAIDAVTGVEVGAVGRLQVDDVAQQHALRDQPIAPLDQRLHHCGAGADRPDHLVAAGLDALGDRDLAFAGQQFDAAHLAQVHPHRVVGRARRASPSCLRSARKIPARTGERRSVRHR